MDETEREGGIDRKIGRISTMIDRRLGTADRQADKKSNSLADR